MSEPINAAACERTHRNLFPTYDEAISECVEKEQRLDSLCLAIRSLASRWLARCPAGTLAEQRMEDLTAELLALLDSEAEPAASAAPPRATIGVTCATCGQPWALGKGHTCGEKTS